MKGEKKMFAGEVLFLLGRKKNIKKNGLNS